MPISVLSAIREATENDITVKGGKFLEAVADADTIVLDKTGTLTNAKPTVVGFNTALIILGVFGVLPPAVSAMLHNGSTLALGLNSMTKLLPEKTEE